MLACFDAEPGAGAGDSTGADIAEQTDPGGGGNAKDTMMKFRRMHGAAAIEQHPAMIECCIHMVAGPFRRHHAGPGRGDIVEPCQLVRLPLPGCLAMRPDKAPAALVDSVDAFIADEIFKPAVGLRRLGQHRIGLRALDTGMLADIHPAGHHAAIAG